MVNTLKEQKSENKKISISPYRFFSPTEMTDDITERINLSKLWVLCSFRNVFSLELRRGGVDKQSFLFVFWPGFSPFITFRPLILEILLAFVSSHVMHIDTTEENAFIEICCLAPYVHIKRYTRALFFHISIVFTYDYGQICGKFASLEIYNSHVSNTLPSSNLLYMKYFGKEVLFSFKFKRI